MRRPRLFRWSDPVQMSGLLLVAQQIEEGLFDYTVDTYKTPTLNTRTRCIELARSIAHVNSGHLSEKSLQSIIEELCWSIGADPAAHVLLGTLTQQAKDLDWWSVKNLKELQAKTDLLRGRLRNGAYEKTLIQEIRARLPDGKRRSELLHLSMSLVVEWLSRGFSRGFIFMMTRAVFFSPSSPLVEDSTTFDSFVSRFQGGKKAHDVVVRMNEASVTLSNLFPEEQVTISRDPPPMRFSNSRERSYLSVPHNGVYAVFHKIEAQDPRSALDFAIRMAGNAARLVAFHAHRDPISIIGDALVYSDGAVTRLKESPLAVHKEGDRGSNELPNACLQTIGRIYSQDNKESWTRMMAALGLHASAISVKDTSVQLTALWSALEALLPIEADEIKINSVINYVVPILCRRYPLRLLAQLDTDLRQCCPEAYVEVHKNLPEEVPEHLRCAAIVAIQKFEPSRTRLYAELSQNPLLQNRIYQLKKATDSAGAISELIDGHRLKVTWHIRRIYRLRNLVTHSGRSYSSATSLVENLHSYFHRVVEAIEECFASPHMALNMNAALLACKVEDYEHKKYLKEHSKSATDEHNLVNLLAGPIFAEASVASQSAQYAHDKIKDI